MKGQYRKDREVLGCTKNGFYGNQHRRVGVTGESTAGSSQTWTQGILYHLYDAGYDSGNVYVACMDDHLGASTFKV